MAQVIEEIHRNELKGDVLAALDTVEQLYRHGAEAAEKAGLDAGAASMLRMMFEDAYNALVRARHALDDALQLDTKL